MCPYSPRNASAKLPLPKKQNNVTVWCNKKTYDDVEVKVREGKEEKIVFAYPKPTVKGIKVLSKTPFIYVYHKKSKQLRYRFD